MRILIGIVLAAASLTVAGTAMAQSPSAERAADRADRAAARTNQASAKPDRAPAGIGSAIVNGLRNPYLTVVRILAKPTRTAPPEVDECRGSNCAKGYPSNVPAKPAPERPEHIPRHAEP